MYNEFSTKRFFKFDILHNLLNSHYANKEGKHFFFIEMCSKNSYFFLIYCNSNLKFRKILAKKYS